MKVKFNPVITHIIHAQVMGELLKFKTHSTNELLAIKQEISFANGTIIYEAYY